MYANNYSDLQRLTQTGEQALVDNLIKGYQYQQALQTQQQQNALEALTRGVQAGNSMAETAAQNAYRWDNAARDQQNADRLFAFNRQQAEQRRIESDRNFRLNDRETAAKEKQANAMLDRLDISKEAARQKQLDDMKSLAEANVPMEKIREIFPDSTPEQWAQVGAHKIMANNLRQIAEGQLSPALDTMNRYSALERGIPNLTSQSGYNQDAVDRAAKIKAKLEADRQLILKHKLPIQQLQNGEWVAVDRPEPDLVKMQQDVDVLNRLQDLNKQAGQYNKVETVGSKDWTDETPNVDIFGNVIPDRKLYQEKRVTLPENRTDMTPKQMAEYRALKAKIDELRKFPIDMKALRKYGDMIDTDGNGKTILRSPITKLIPTSFPYGSQPSGNPYAVKNLTDNDKLNQELAAIGTSNASPDEKQKSAEELYQKYSNDFSGKQ